jgi:hypothetical protein
MLSTGRSKIILVTVTSIILLLAISLVFINPPGKSSVSVTIAGDAKNLIISSDVDGVIGTFTTKEFTFSLSKNKHIIKFTSKGYMDESFTIDATKEKNKKINLDLRKLASSNESLESYFGTGNYSDKDNCKYFANNTWSYCEVNYGDYVENNIFKKVDSRWVFIAGGSSIDSASLDDTDAPDEVKQLVGTSI